MRFEEFKILEPVSKEFLAVAAKQRNLRLSKNYVHPQEDYLWLSEKHPIFVVADGVTLEPDKDGRYLSPSPAGAVARIFCERVIKETEKLYDNFTADSIRAVFAKANQAVGEYNFTNGRTKDKINFWDFDLLAATGAFAVIKDDTVFWVSICDSYVACFDKNGKQKFKSSGCWIKVRKNMSRDWKNIDEAKRRKIIRRVYRNGVDESGNLIGYGVITGEEVAWQYANKGSFKINEGDLFFLFTDGFEHYFELPEFIGIFKNWPTDLTVKVKEFTAQKEKENPEKFGRERTLVVVKFTPLLGR